MRASDPSLPFSRVALFCAVSAALVACGGTEPSGTDPSPDVLQLTAKDVGALDSTGREITQANPGNGTLKSLVDSTLLVLTAGVEARRLDVATNLTTKPLYFVGVHRVVSRGNSSFSTWTLVGMDDPSKLTSLVEVSGFAQAASATAPTSVTGTIGDGTGLVNGLLLAVGDGGSVTEWRAASGPVSLSSSAAGAPCPNFTSSGSVTITCNLETIRARFTLNAPNGSGGASARSASVAAEVDVPAMRLTYTF